MRSLALLAACAATLLCTGCGDTDNDRIQVKNRTDDPIRVSYDQEVAYPGYTDTDGDGDLDPRIVVEQRREWIPAHADRDIWVRDILWFTYVEVRYRGRTKIYDLTVDLVGVGTLWVRPEDFDEELAAPLGAG